MKLSFAALAALATLGLSVLAAPAPQDSTPVPVAFPFRNRPGIINDLLSVSDIGSGVGERFEDGDGSTFPDPFRVNRIIVVAGERINQVQVNLSGPNGDINNIHGGPDGSTRTTIDLAAGETVINLKVWRAGESGVAGLAMTTSGGRTFNSGKQGGPPDANFDAPPSQDDSELRGLAGFIGSVDKDEVVSIGPIWASTTQVIGSGFVGID